MSAVPLQKKQLNPWANGDLSRYTVAELIEKNLPGALLEILSRASNPDGLQEIKEWWQTLSPEIRQELRNEYDDPESDQSSEKPRRTNALQSSKLRSTVWNKTGGKCWYCNHQTSPWADFCIDHIVPISNGGTDELDNLVPCCRSCNAKKGDR